MEKCIINRKSIKKIVTIKQAQKLSKKYYQDRLFEKTTHEPKAKIQKLVNINNLELINSINAQKADDQMNYEKNCNTTAHTTSNSDLKLTKKDLLALCERNQLFGRSGNGYSTAKKLASFHAESGVLLINGVECDPGLVHDAWIYRNCLKEIDKGVKLLYSIYHFNKIVLATKEPLQNGTYSFKQVKVKNRFPMGYENYLIETLFNKKIPSGKFPTDMGILVLNLQSILAISRIFAEINSTNDISNNAPCAAGNCKYITVSNLSNATAKVMEVQLGQNIYDIARKAFSNISENVYTGSGAFNCHKADSEEVVDQKTFFIAIGQMPDYSNAGKCMGCGKCTNTCPAGVQVSKIIRFVEKNGRQNGSMCSAFHLELCIGCGACTYMCSAGKDTREVVAWAKSQL